MVRRGKDRGEWRFARYPSRMCAYLKVQPPSTSMVGPMVVVVSSNGSHILDAEAEALLIPASVVLTLRKPAKGEAAGFGVVQRWASPPCSQGEFDCSPTPSIWENYRTNGRIHRVHSQFCKCLASIRYSYSRGGLHG